MNYLKRNWYIYCATLISILLAVIFSRSIYFIDKYLEKFNESLFFGIVFFALFISLLLTIRQLLVWKEFNKIVINIALLLAILVENASIVVSILIKDGEGAWAVHMIGCILSTILLVIQIFIWIAVSI